MYYSIWCCLVLASSVVVVQSSPPQYFDALTKDFSLLSEDPSIKDKITWEKVSAAAEEWEHMGASEGVLMKSDPRKFLVLGSIILPFLKKARGITGEDHRRNRMDEMFRCYQFFEPYYLRGETIGEPVLYASAPKSDLIFKVAIGAIKGRLKIAEFLGAKDEIKTLYQQHLDIVDSGDMCIRSERLKMILNRSALPYMRELLCVTNENFPNLCTSPRRESDATGWLIPQVRWDEWGATIHHQSVSIPPLPPLPNKQRITSNKSRTKTLYRMLHTLLPIYEDDGINSRSDEVKLLHDYRELLRSRKIKVLVDDNGSTVSEGKISELANAIERKYADRSHMVPVELIGEAIEEYRGLSQEMKDLLDLDPRLKMVVDFAILSTDHDRDLMKRPAYFLQLIISRYFDFRRAYVEQKAIDDDIPSMASFEKLIKFGLGDYHGQPTKQDFIKAKSQFDYWVKRIKRYSREKDIHLNTMNLKAVMNLQNDERSKIFVQSIYPDINEEMDPIKVFDIFRDALTKGVKTQVSEPKGEEAINKLRQALEEAHESKSERNLVTVELIEQALAEYKQLNQYRIQRMNSEDFLRMVVDFAIIPMKYEIDTGKRSDPQQFVDRLVKQYTRFRSFYVDRKFSSRFLPKKLDSLWYLYELAMQCYAGEPTVRDFIEAKSEIDYWKRKFYNLRGSYIYAHLDEWENKVNFEGMFYVKLFLNHIYPLINEAMDPIKAMADYRDQLKGSVNVLTADPKNFASINKLIEALESSIHVSAADNPVTLELVKKAADEYKRLGKYEKIKGKRYKLLRIALDLAILPMKYGSSNEGKINNEGFVHQITEAYKHFRPSFLNNKYIGDKTIPEKTGAILELINIASNVIDERPTVDLFLNAKKEADDLVKEHENFKGESDTYKSPYEDLVEFEKIRNLSNYPAYQVFLDFISPYVKDEFDPEALLRKFREYLADEGKITQPNIKSEGLNDL